MYYILALTYEQAADHAARENRTEWAFVCDEQTLRGLRQHEQIHTIPGWDRRPDYLLLRREITRRNLEVVVEKAVA